MTHECCICNRLEPNCLMVREFPQKGSLIIVTRTRSFLITWDVHGSTGTPVMRVTCWRGNAVQVHQLSPSLSPSPFPLPRSPAPALAWHLSSSGRWPWQQQARVTSQARAQLLSQPVAAVSRVTPARGTCMEACLALIAPCVLAWLRTGWPLFEPLCAASPANCWLIADTNCLL